MKISKNRCGKPLFIYTRYFEVQEEQEEEKCQQNGKMFREKMISVEKQYRPSLVKLSR